MRKAIGLVVFGCAVLAVSQAGELVSPLSSPPDFRQAAWGMTQAEVLATEAAQPSEIRESSGEIIVRYDSIQLGGLACRVVYIFADDKLVRAKYVFDAEHREPNDFIRDYRAIEPLLHDMYGKPVSERAFWSDDSLQDEPKSYLEQDRASATDILPSDQFAGPSIAAGHLKLYTRWRGDRTKISHGLTGENSRITHQIEFLSVELERLENDVRGASRN
ncbi:MAG: hypothetical protein LAP61_16380 [Acidobacteriia bacterium]|nr:hypothetical protein [Terriglobia bacterium]